MNDLSPPRLTYDDLFRRAAAEWPETIDLPRREVDGGSGYIVEGLYDLEDEIDRRARGSREGVLLVHLHWAIMTAVHGALGSSPSVRVLELEPVARRKFHADLRDMTAEEGWSVADLALRDRYLRSNVEAA